MRTIDPARSTLLLVDLQQRLVPAMDGGEAVVANAARLIAAAAAVGVPAATTEQYPKGLGPTVVQLSIDRADVLEKLEFDASRNSGFSRLMPPERPDFVIAGCEAHVCVLQTALGLLDGKRKVYVVADAIASRAPASKQAAIERMQRHGVEIVTTEMVLFEWLQTAGHPRFKEVTALIK
jgi:nicotinamidase-related amidase